MKNESEFVRGEIMGNVVEGGVAIAIWLKRIGAVFKQNVDGPESLLLESILQGGVSHGVFANCELGS